MEKKSHLELENLSSRHEHAYGGCLELRCDTTKAQYYY